MSKRAYQNPKKTGNNSGSEYSVYMPHMISMKVHLNMSEVGDNTRQNLERKIYHRIAGKCISEGYVRPDSIKLTTYSSGVIKMNTIEFQVVFSCLICNPVEGMIVECQTRTITKAGIHADVITDKGYLPMKVFVARDHNYSNAQFGSIKENMNIKVRIIGKRYELNDEYIVAIASLLENRQYAAASNARPPVSAAQRITVLPDELSSDEEEVVDLGEGAAPEEDAEAEAEAEGERQAPISLPTANKSPEEGEIIE